MPRPKPEEPTQQVGLRVPESLIRRADLFAAQLSRETPGLQITRTDAIRIILTRHLPQLPDEQAQTSPSPVSAGQGARGAPSLKNEPVSKRGAKP